MCVSVSLTVCLSMWLSVCLCEGVSDCVRVCGWCLCGCMSVCVSDCVRVCEWIVPRRRGSIEEASDQQPECLGDSCESTQLQDETLPTEEQKALDIVRLGTLRLGIWGTLMICFCVQHSQIVEHTVLG